MSKRQLIGALDLPTCAEHPNQAVLAVDRGVLGGRICDYQSRRQEAEQRYQQRMDRLYRTLNDLNRSQGDAEMRAQLDDVTMEMEVIVLIVFESYQGISTDSFCFTSQR